MPTPGSKTPGSAPLGSKPPVGNNAGNQSAALFGGKPTSAGGWSRLLPAESPGPVSIGQDVWLLLGLLALYLFFAQATDLFDRDEPRFARATVEMLQTGDWIVPRFNGDLRPDKPAGIYWFQSVSVWLFGVGAWAVRLPSCFGMVLAAACTNWVGRHWFDGLTGRRAMAMFGTAGLCLWIGTAATSDGVLIGAMGLAIAATLTTVPVAHGQVQGAGRWTWGRWLCVVMGLSVAQLVKGPVGLLVPMLTAVGVGLCLNRIHRKDGREALLLKKAWWLGLVAAAVVGTLPVVAWGIAAGIQTDWVLIQDALGRHVGQRMVKPAEGHGGRGLVGYLLALPLYVPLILGTFFPWTLYLPAGVSALVRKHLGTAEQRAMLVGWLVPTLVFMSLVATKLPHYVLGIYPALALLSAAVVQTKKQLGALDAPVKTSNSAPGKASSSHQTLAWDAAVHLHRPWHAHAALGEKDRDWWRGGVWFVGPLGLGLIGGLLWLGGQDPRGGFSQVGWPVAGLMGLAALFFGAKTLRYQLKEQVDRAWRSWKQACFALLGLLWCTLPSVLPGLQISRPFADAMQPLAEVALPGGDVWLVGQSAATVEQASGLSQTQTVQPMATLAYNEPSLVFYANRPASQPVKHLSGMDGEDGLEGWLQTVPHPAWVVLTEPQLKAWEQAWGGSPHWRVWLIEKTNVINYAKRGQNKTICLVLVMDAKEGLPAGMDEWHVTNPSLFDMLRQPGLLDLTKPDVLSDP